MVDDVRTDVPLERGADLDVEPDEAPDFAVAAYREEGRWVVVPLPVAAAAALGGFVTTLRQLPGDGGVLGMACYDDDFFLAVRVRGPEARVLLSDATAAEDWPVAREALEATGEPMPDADDEPAPAGDLGMLTDLGLDEWELRVLCDDPDLYPDEVLADIAERLGFRAGYEEAVDAGR